MTPLKNILPAILVGGFFVVVIGIPAAYYGRASARTAELEALTDPLTHCQYLESRGGHLTPRMDVDGRQMGCTGSIHRPDARVRKTWPGIDAPKG